MRYPFINFREKKTLEKLLDALLIKQILELEISGFFRKSQERGKMNEASYQDNDCPQSLNVPFALYVL